MKTKNVGMKTRYGMKRELCEKINDNVARINFRLNVCNQLNKRVDFICGVLHEERVPNDEVDKLIKILKKIKWRDSLVQDALRDPTVEAKYGPDDTLPRLYQVDESMKRLEAALIDLQMADQKFLEFVKTDLRRGWLVTMAARITWESDDEVTINLR